jgi:hypothetical protein
MVGQPEVGSKSAIDGVRFPDQSCKSRLHSDLERSSNLKEPDVKVYRRPATQFVGLIAAVLAIHAYILGRLPRPKSHKA